MNLRMLGVAVVAAAALTAFVGVSSASATVLCSTNTNPCTGTKYAAGTEVKSNLVAGTKWKLATSFKTIECSKSSIGGKTGNTGGSTETIRISFVELIIIEECNCTVIIFRSGSEEWHFTSGGNWSYTWSGLEFSVTCSSIFGNVHCIYVTENTNMGTGSGGNPAKLTFNAALPRLTTDALCAEKANLNAEYEVTAPKPLFAEGS